MKKILLATSVLTVIGGAAFAGGYTQPVVEAPVAVAPAPVVAEVPNWTGFYVGGNVGYGKPGGALSHDGAIGGLNAGYLWDQGSYVLGGELGYNWADMGKDETGKLKSTTDLKFIAGVPYGSWLPYATVGASQVKATIANADYSDTVPMIGVGVKYAIDNNWSVGSELNYRHVGNFDGREQKLDFTTITAGVNYRF